MKVLILLLIVIGLILITIGYVKTNQFCPPQKVEYRYIPRTFEQEQNNQLPLMAIHGKMFKDISPLENSYGGII
jgi:hypothetical protein